MFTKNEIEEIRKEFPFLNLKPNGKPIVYLDNGATTQKPREVIDNIKNFYENKKINIEFIIEDLEKIINATKTDNNIMR